MFLAVFHVCFDVHYDMSNESWLRWWINGNIHDFIVPTYICGDPPHPCTVWREGHRPKVLLWIMEEFFYISHNLTEEDRNGHVVLSYELIVEAEHRYRDKMGWWCQMPPFPSHAGSAPLCSPEMLECIAWAKPESKTLECLVWSVYDGLLSSRPTLKPVGPESYNQVTKHLAAKVFRGLQVQCSVRTSAQFDELPTPKLRSIVLAPPQSEIARKTEAMDTASSKTEDAGGRSCRRWPTHRSRQISNVLDAWPSALVWWWNDWILAPALPVDGCERNHCSAAGMLPSINLALVLSNPSHFLPPPQPTWKSGNGCH